MIARPFAPVAIAMVLATTGCASTEIRPSSVSATIAGIEARLERLRILRQTILPLLPADRAARIERAIVAAEHLLTVARVAADVATRAAAIDRVDRSVDDIETAAQQ